MKLWQALYAMIWLVFIEFMIAMTPGAPGWTIYLHVVFGLAILGLAYYDFKSLREAPIPGRIKRIAKSTFQLSVLMVILGVLLLFDVGQDWIIPVINLSVFGVILFIHVVNAFAIITQAAAVAIAYDMWEDKEFNQETKPGEIPPPPMPARMAPKP